MASFKRWNFSAAIRKLALWYDGVEPESAPTITSGTGVPTATEPAGSAYLRTNGSVYTTTGSAVWTTNAAGADFGATGLLSDVIAESTSATGVTVDGVLLKDGGIVCADAASLEVDTINEATAATGVTIDGVLIKDTTVDLNGTAAALILDADADTHIGASTDDQIDITIGGAIDFVLTANTLTASSGSSIATNTITETTGGSGVTIDSTLIKDGSVQPAAITDPGNAGAIPVTRSGVCAMTSAGAETRTIAIPTFSGQRIVLVCDTYVGDIVVTVAAAANVGNNNTLTFGAESEALELVGVTVGGSLVWQIGWNDGVGLTTV